MVAGVYSSPREQGAPTLRTFRNGCLDVDDGEFGEFLAGTVRDYALECGLGWREFGVASQLVKGWVYQYGCTSIMAVPVWLCQ